MNYGNTHHRKRRDSESLESSSAYSRQRTIPEMLAGHPENMNRHAGRSFEYNSELAAAPSNPAMQPRSPYYSAMDATFDGHPPSYNTPHHRRQQFYPSSSTPQRGDREDFYERPQRGDPEDFYGRDALPVHHQRYSPYPQKPVVPQNQPYFGVPGFYAPSTEYDEPPVSVRTAPSYASTTAIKKEIKKEFYADMLPPVSTRAVAQPPPQRAPPSPFNFNRNYEATHAPAFHATSASPDNFNKRTVLRTPEATITRPPTPTASPRMASKNDNTQDGAKFDIQDKSKSSETAPKPQRRELLLKVHFLSGPVSRVLKWENLRHSYQMIFEVIALLKAMRDGGSHMELLLRDDKGPVLQVLFYEIDRPMPPLELGQTVRVVGRLIGRARLQAFSVRAASDVEVASLQRISFVCHRAATKMLEQPSVLPNSAAS